MNEVTSFCNGECPGSSGKNRIPNVEMSPFESQFRHRKDGRVLLKRSVGFDPNNPPYAINNFGSQAPLNTKTLDMDALYLDNRVLEYDAHNLFGISEAMATSNALEDLIDKRSFVISRSTFPGSGQYTGHWTGWHSFHRGISFILLN